MSTSAISIDVAREADACCYASGGRVIARSSVRPSWWVLEGWDLAPAAVVVVVMVGGGGGGGWWRQFGSE